MQIAICINALRIMRYIFYNLITMRINRTIKIQIYLHDNSDVICISIFESHDDT